MTQMDLVKIRFSTDEDYDRGAAGLARHMDFVTLRGGFLVVPVAALLLLSQWGCRFEIVARSGWKAA